MAGGRNRLIHRAETLVGGWLLSRTSVGETRIVLKMAWELSVGRSATGEIPKIDQQTTNLELV